jgi:hypothetical protein
MELLRLDEKYYPPIDAPIKFAWKCDTTSSREAIIM